MKKHVAKLRKTIADWMRQTGADEIFSGQESEDGSHGSFIEFGHPEFGLLSVGLDIDGFRETDKHAQRIFWFPCGRPTGTSVALVTSRLGQQPENYPVVFDAIRTCCCRIEREQQFLLTHDKLAIHSTLVRAAQNFGVSIYQFKAMPRELSAEWFESELSNLSARELTQAIYYDANRCLDDAVSPDDLLIDTSREVRVLKVRSGGNICNAVTRRLESESTSRSTFVLHEENPDRKSAHRQLVEHGAVWWYLYEANNSLFRSAPGTTVLKNNIQALDEFVNSNDVGEYLLHWTRRRVGPWPEQTEQQFQDDLILGTDSARHDRYSALVKILVDQKLIASNAITRDARPVVSFSAVTVDQLLDRRIFRSHLSRWDFETVGIAVSRDVLNSLGVRPVIYGGEELWHRMDESRKPFFQKSDGNIDWSVEKEWRVIGDVDLSRLPLDDAFVFVDSNLGAERVARFTNLKVVVLSPD